MQQITPMKHYNLKKKRLNDRFVEKEEEDKDIEKITDVEYEEEKVRTIHKNSEEKALRLKAKIDNDAIAVDKMLKEKSIN